MSKPRILAASITFMTVATLGGAALGWMGHSLSQNLRQINQVTSKLLASRVGDELSAIAERSRFLVSTGDAERFRADPALLALSVLKMPESSKEDADWDLRTRWSRHGFESSSKDEENDGLSIQELEEVDAKFPIDFTRVSEGKTEVVWAELGNGTPFLRLGIPWGEKSQIGFHQAIVADLRLEKLSSLFSRINSSFAFLATREGRLLASSDPSHFTTAEDLSALPILQFEHESRHVSLHDEQGSLDYSEVPNGSKQLATFQRVLHSNAGLIVVSQIPRSELYALLKPWIAAVAALALVLSALAALGAHEPPSRQPRF